MIENDCCVCCQEIIKDPQLISGGHSRFDVIQGELGDCWMLVAAANLTLRDELFYRVVPPDQSFTENYAGTFPVNLSQNNCNVNECQWYRWCHSSSSAQNGPSSIWERTCTWVASVVCFLTIQCRVPTVRCAHEWLLVYVWWNILRDFPLSILAVWEMGGRGDWRPTAHLQWRAALFAFKRQRRILESSPREGLCQVRIVGCEKLSCDEPFGFSFLPALGEDKIMSSRFELVQNCMTVDVLNFW